VIAIGAGFEERGNNVNMIAKADTDLFPWILTGIVAAVVAAGLYIAAIQNDGARNDRIPARATDAPSPSNPSPTTLDRKVASAKPSGLPATHVWECTMGGQRIFSDSPCGDRSTVRQLNEINRMDATPVSPPVTYSNSPDPGYAPDNLDQFTAQGPNDSVVCEGFKEEVNAIHERMRHPYTNPEGNYLRGRLHEISDRQYELHCLR
jgi:hypothetical protein